MCDPTPEELIVVDKFRHQIQDLNLSAENSTDLQLLRWLRARDLSIPKANEMLRKSLEWRKQTNIAEWEPPEHFAKEYPYEIAGIDKATGNPVFIVPVGSWDTRKAVAQGEMDTLVLYSMKAFEHVGEKLKEASKLVGREITQTKFLLDFENFSFRTLKAVSSLLLPVSRQFEDNYPETMHSCVLINCSPAFQILFALLKAILSGRTLSKVQVFSAEKHWKPVVNEMFPMELLPEKYGGTRKSAMLTDSKSSEYEDGDDWTTKEISPRSKHEIEIDVSGPNMEIIWIFCLGKQEIGFVITRKDTGADIIPHKLYKLDCSNANAEAETVTGSIGCDSGKYIAKFDNSCGKEKQEIKYTFSVVKK